MTSPGLVPRCAVYVDGVRAADGQPSETDDQPVILDDLVVVWGRNNTLDQPAPATCNFRILDVPGGQRFLSMIHIGSRVRVQADATIYPNPDVSTIPTLIPNPVVNGTATGSGTTSNTLLATSTAGSALVVTYPPRSYSTSPSAWDAVPRSAAGQAWRVRVDVTIPALAMGWRNYAVQVNPVAFTAPTAKSAVVLPEKQRLTAPASGDARFDLTFVPPEGVWLGLQVRIHPVGPRWQDLVGAWTAFGAAPRTNLANTPSGNALGEFSQNGTGALSLVAGWGARASAVRFTRSTTAAARFALNAVMPLSVPVTVRIQLRASVALSAVQVNLRPNLSGSANQVALGIIDIPAGVSTFDFTASTPPVDTTSTSGLALVFSSGAIGSTLDMTGIQIEPGATIGSFFDGSTPDAGGIDYAWTGTPDASSSTATDARGAVSWNSLDTFVVRNLIMSAPAAGAQRSGAVFDGRCTDLDASYDEGIGGTVVAVICQDDTAELGNRYVGAAPYPLETVSSRFSKVVNDSGQAIDWTVDAGAGSKQVSYQDVDARPATDLLQLLARSVAGVLWCATSLASGPFLRLEDIASRPTLLLLSWDPPPVTNLFTKPSFEDGLTTNFSPTGVTLTVITTAQPPVAGRSGTKLLRTTATVAGATDIGMANPIKPPATVGHQYRISAYVRAGQTPAVGSAYIAAEYRDASNVLVPGTQVNGLVSVLGATTNWKRVEVTLAAAPATAATLTFNLRIQSGTGVVVGSIVDWDAILVYDVTADPGQVTADYFDGDTPAAGGLVFAWDGAQWGSTSTQYGQAVIVANPAASGIKLDACSVLLEPVHWTQDSQDDATRVVLTWREQTTNPDPPPAVEPTDREETATDVGREAATGRRRVGITTNLSQQATAAVVANLYLARLQAPGWRVSGLVIDLAYETLDPAMLANVMRILDGATRLGLPIMLTNLPDWSPTGDTQDQALYLEGGRFINAAGRWRLELLVSNASAQGKSALRWVDLPTGLPWTGLAPLTWNDLIGVGI